MVKFVHHCELKDKLFFIIYISIEHFYFQITQFAYVSNNLYNVREGGKEKAFLSLRLKTIVYNRFIYAFYISIYMLKVPLFPLF